MAEEIPLADARGLGPVRLMETEEEVAYELRAAEGATYTGGRFLLGIAAFCYASLAFAYFYLRTSNNANDWRPGHMTAPTSIGAAIFSLTILVAALQVLGQSRLRRGLVLDWKVAGWMAVFFGLLAIGLQIWQLTQLSFPPGTSGYSSCFIGWAVSNIAMLVCGVYWTETLLARAMRISRAVAEDGGPSRSTLPAARLFRANLDASVYYWVFSGLVGLLFWLLFYVL